MEHESGVLECRYFKFSPNMGYINPFLLSRAANNYSVPKVEKTGASTIKLLFHAKNAEYHPSGNNCYPHFSMFNKIKHKIFTLIF